MFQIGALVKLGCHEKKLYLGRFKSPNKYPIGCGIIDGQTLVSTPIRYLST